MAQNNFAFSAGFGFFPSLFGLQFQTFGLGAEVRVDGRAPTADELQQLLMSRVLAAIVCVVCFMLLFL